jgi:hypothetical protein
MVIECMNCGEFFNEEEAFEGDFCSEECYEAFMEDYELDSDDEDD